MGSAVRYSWTRSDGSTGRGWRARWSDGSGTRREKRGFERKGDALGYAADREAEARHGTHLPGERSSSRLTVQQWSGTWLAGLDVRPSTQASYDWALSHILPAYGGRLLTSLRPSELRSWGRSLTRSGGHDLAASSGEKVMSVFATMLRAAVQDELLVRSPMPPKRGTGRQVRVLDPSELLTPEQVLAWSAALPPVLAAAPVVAAMTGLRQGELLGLRPGDVDFLRRQVRVAGQLRTPRGAGRPEFGPTKTPAGMRTVPLPALAAQALARHMQAYPSVDGEPLFRTLTGRRWRAAGFQAAAVAARRAAGLPDWATWHALRDVYASSLIRQGVDVRTVMALLGHVSAEETLRTYARLWGDAADNARGLLDALWAAGGQQGATDTAP